MQFVNGFGIYNYGDNIYNLPIKSRTYQTRELCPYSSDFHYDIPVIAKFLGKVGSFNKNLQFLLADTFRSRADNEEASNCLLIMDRNTHL